MSNAQQQVFTNNRFSPDTITDSDFEEVTTGTNEVDELNSLQTEDPADILLIITPRRACLIIICSMIAIVLTVVATFFITKETLSKTQYAEVRNCSWSFWSSWSKCSITCGNGVQVRIRKQMNYTMLCSYNETFDSQTCSRNTCAVSNGQQYQLTLIKQEEFVLVGASPEYKCTVNQNANFLINNPLNWEKRGRDGSNVVISVLANVVRELEDEYNVQLDVTDFSHSFTLSFQQGIKDDYDGHFACVLYNKSNTVLAEKAVNIHVIRTIQKTEFEIDKKQTVSGESALSIRLEEGFHKPICRTEGSNPAAVVQIYLDDTLLAGDPQVEVPDTSRTKPPTVYNVEKTVTIYLKLNDDNKILKCVAKVHDDDTMKTEISYKLEVFRMTNGQQYRLILTKQEDFVLVGASPKYKCTVNQNFNFLLGHPLMWEKRGRDGSTVVISILAIVVRELEDEYNVHLEATDITQSFTLSFKQGIKDDYDGHFACVLYNKSNTVLIEKAVNIHVIRTIQKTEFEIDKKKQTVSGEPALSIILGEGVHKPVCRTEGSNPAAVVQIYLDDTLLVGDPQVEVPDTSRTKPPTVYNVEKSVTISLKPDDNNKILKCVAKVHDDDTMKTEISYKLEVLRTSNGQQYRVILTKQEDFVLVGASPKYKCIVNQNANFLIVHPLMWEKRGRDGSTVVISVLANVVRELEDEYNVQLDVTDFSHSFTLSFQQGIKDDYDGHFACVLYNKSNTVLAEKAVNIHVIRTIQKTEFEIYKNKQTVSGEPALSIILGEGVHKPICRTEGSNPAAVVQIYLDDTLLVGDSQVEVPDTSRTKPPTVYNVEKSVTIYLKPDDNNKILKCVAKVHDDDTMKTEIAYKLEVLSTNGQQYRLTLPRQEDFVLLGASPKYKCTVNQNANFLIVHPLMWEKRGRDGSTVVISVLANVVREPEDEYFVHLDVTDITQSFTLSFKQGIKEDYDGHFACVLYYSFKREIVLTEKTVDVHVIC